MIPSVTDPDVVVVAEGFASGGANEEHLGTEAFRRFGDRLHELCLEGRFMNIFAHRVEPDRADFTATR